MAKSLFSLELVQLHMEAIIAEWLKKYYFLHQYFVMIRYPLWLQHENQFISKFNPIS